MLTKYSHSSLETFRQCPRLYWFRKIEKPPVPKQLYAHNHLGNAVHEQLKIAYQWALENKLYPLDEMLRGFESAWDGGILEKVVVASENQAIDDEIESGRRMLRIYHKQYQPFDQDQLKLAEQMLSFELPNCPAGFHAKPDRVSQRKDGVVEICDYKTGKQMVAGATDRKFRLQMGLYQLGVQAAFPQFEQIEVAQYFLRHDEVVRCRLRPDELDELAEQFRSELHQIANAERLDDWPEKESGLCRFCDYAHICPKKRHQAALEAEDDTGEPTSAEQAAELADKYLLWNGQKKTAEAKLRELRDGLVTAAKDLGASKLYGSDGHVLVSIKNAEKLPTKKEDPSGQAEVTALVRSWGEEMELCLKLDDRALLEVVRKGRLVPEKLEQLQQYLRVKESTVVRAFPKAVDKDED